MCYGVVAALLHSSPNNRTAQQYRQHEHLQEPRVPTETLHLSQQKRCIGVIAEHWWKEFEGTENLLMAAIFPPIIMAKLYRLRTVGSAKNNFAVAERERDEAIENVEKAKNKKVVAKMILDGQN
jgi:hypothetical protein